MFLRYWHPDFLWRARGVHRGGIEYSIAVGCCVVAFVCFVFVLFANSNVCMTQIAQILCMTQMSKKWPNLIKMSGVCPLCPELGLMQFLIWSYWIVISGKSQNALSPFSVSGLSHFWEENLFPFLCHHIYLVAALDSDAVECQQRFFEKRNVWYFIFPAYF